MRKRLPDRFTLIRMLRETRDCKTFLASDRLANGRNVIVKLFRKNSLTSDRASIVQLLSWFLGVRHRHIAVMLDAGFTAAGDVYCAREYFPNSGLSSVNEVDIIRSLLSTVSFLHSAGRIHGAIKPSNVFLSNGILKLTDATIGNLNTFDNSEEHVRFNAPEVLQGSQATAKSDLYSVGAFVYQLLTGEHPFNDSELNHLKLKYIWASPEPISQNCAVPVGTSDAVLQLLEKDPAKRNRGLDVLIKAVRSEIIVADRGPCLGRDAFVAEFRRVIANASQRNLQALLLEGEPGIGKSRLVQEFRITCGLYRRQMVICRCEATARPFQPILEGIRQLLKLRRTTSNPEVAKFSSALSEVGSLDMEGIPPSRAYQIEKITNELVGLVSILTRSNQSVFVLEDIDQADVASLGFIRQLSFRAAEISLQLILTRRSKQTEFALASFMSEVLREDFHRFRLLPLTPQDEEKLVQVLEKCPERRKTVLALSAGNPRFLEEYAKADSTVQMPVAIKEAVAWMLSNISKKERAVVDALSLFNGSMSVEVLARICGETPSSVRQNLDALCTLGLARMTDSHTKIHPTVRATIYKGISRKKRIGLNQNAFNALEHTVHPLPDVARYAYEGALFDQAGALYRRLAIDAANLKKHKLAATYFERMADCAERGGSQLQPVEWARLAKCYQFSGRIARAEKVYGMLLARDTVLRDPELLSQVYIGLASTHNNKRPSERIALNRLAIQCLEPNSSQLAVRYTQLCCSLLRLGDLAAAKEALAHAEEGASKYPAGSVAVQAAKASFFLNTMDFRAASECLTRLTHPERAALLINLALCFEHQGNLKRACVLLSQAQQAAIANGNVELQILSLSNLGCVRTKLGCIRDAQQLLESAMERIEGLRRTEPQFNVSVLVTCYADAALHYIQTARYGRAVECLRRTRTRAGWIFESDRIFCAMVRCALYVHIGQQKKVQHELRLLENSPAFKSPFFQIEKAIIEANLDDGRITQTIEVINDRLVAAHGLGTEYQRCQLLNVLAASLIRANEKQQALPYAKHAFRLARKNGYRLLATKALILTGICIDEPAKKHRCLYTAFQQACEMDLPELVAESASYIGIFQLECKNFVTAREYLVRCISIAQGIADGLPEKFRTGYVAKPWYRASRKALEICNGMPQGLSSASPSVVSAQQAKYFRAIYQFSISAMAASSADGLLTALLATIDPALKRPVMLMMRHGDSLVMKAAKIRASEDLIQRITDIGKRSQNRIHIGATDAAGRKETFAWIPLISETYSGGIYVVCRQHQAIFTAREMEFMSLLRTIGNGALTQLEARMREEKPAPAFSHSHGIIGASKAIKEVYSQIEIAAGNAATVLIEGESGTGKELVARAIHAAGPRAKEAFIPVDCGAIPESLIEAELFGAKRGAYTGAVADRPGLFEAAHRGTIFLDEISNTAPALQAKLLRVIQEREVRRIGETKDRQVDVRLIAASNQNLEALAHDGRFRKDLLYRLKVLHIKVPPLRSRLDDIPMLAQAFLQKLNAANNTKKQFAPGIVSHLSMQQFPGNVRELQNAIERVFFSTKGNTITEVPLEQSPAAASIDEVQSWFKELSEGRKDFWSAIHHPYKRRDISREKVVALVDFGLRSTRGSYKTMAAMFRMKDRDYRRFMDFLRRNDCLLDFRPYRQSAAGASTIS